MILISIRLNALLACYVSNQHHSSSVHHFCIRKTGWVDRAVQGLSEQMARQGWWVMASDKITGAMGCRKQMENKGFPLEDVRSSLLEKSVPFSESDHWSQEASQTGPCDKTWALHTRRSLGRKHRLAERWRRGGEQTQQSTVGAACFRQSPDPASYISSTNLAGQNGLLGANTDKITSCGGAEVNSCTGLWKEGRHL